MHSFVRRAPPHTCAVPHAETQGPLAPPAHPDHARFATHARSVAHPAYPSKHAPLCPSPHPNHPPYRPPDTPPTNHHTQLGTNPLRSPADSSRPAAPRVRARHIALPISEQEPLPAGGVSGLELSGSQLEVTHSLACEVAILTNITPDHLERNGTMAAYADAKARLFAMQKPGSTAIVGKAAQSTWSVA